VMGRSGTDVIFRVQRRDEKRKDCVALWWDGAVQMLCWECNRELRKERTAWHFDGTERYRCYVQSAKESWEKKNSVALWWDGAVQMLCWECNRELRKERTAWLCDGTELYRCYIQSATDSWEKKEQRGFGVGRSGTDVMFRVQQRVEKRKEKRVFVMGRSCKDVMFRVQQRVEKRKNSVAFWWDGAVQMLCSECNRELRKERTAWLCCGTELYRCYVQSETDGWEKKE
jgi:hypothetical protein